MGSQTISLLIIGSQTISLLIIGSPTTVSTIQTDINKGLSRVKHGTTPACRQGKVEQVNIKNKCRQFFIYHCKKLDIIICWTHCILNIRLALLFQASNMPSKNANFWAPLRNKIAIVYGSSITHKDDNFAKKLH